MELEELVCACEQTVSVEEVQALPQFFDFPAGLQVFVEAISLLLGLLDKRLDLSDALDLLCGDHLFQLAVQLVA